MLNQRTLRRQLVAAGYLAIAIWQAPGLAQERAGESRAAQILQMLMAQHDTSTLADRLVAGPQGHRLAKSQNLLANPVLRINVATTTPFAGTAIDLAFHLGSPDSPAADLFGIGFELHYSDDRYLVFNPPNDAVAGDFLQPDVYTFTRHEPERRIFYLAVSRKRGAPGQDGEGIVLTLPLRLAEDAVPGWEVCFQIRNVIANNAGGTPLTIESGPAVCLTVGEPAVEVVPNPITPNGDGMNDVVEFKRDGGIPADWVIHIMDRNGIILRTLTGGADRWDGRDADGRLQLPGVYLYTIRDGERVVRRGVLGIIR